jgi:hypothetical protein
MFRDKEFFEHLSPAIGSVILGDGKTTLAIHGIGIVKCQLGENIVTIPDVRYIPGLSESIYSLFLHIKSPDHGVESSFEDGLYLKFPTFKSKAIIGSDDIYLDMIPLSLDTITLSTEQISSTDLSPTMFCRPVTETNQLNEENGRLHNILKDLHRYYGEVKTNHQLGLQVPNGFHPKSSIQQQFILHTPPRKSAATIDSLSSSPPSLVSQLEDLSTTSIHSNRTSSHQESTDTTADNVRVDSLFIPIVRSVNKPLSSLPRKISMTEDYLRSCVGFRRVDTLKKNITLDHTPPDAILDPGYYATLRKKDRNTTPVPRPEKFGDVIHIDIVFGP